MDVLIKLLSPSHSVKPEDSSKDRKGKAQQYRQLTNVKDFEGEAITQGITKDTSSWNEVERRSGKDRRDESKCRGRWLESREEKNRRELAKAIQIQI